MYLRHNKYYEKIGKITKDITEEIPFTIPDSWRWCRLGSIVTIETGKKDANYASTDGQYLFFTCAKEALKCNNYSFSGKSLILPGNGANVGLCILFDGKFEAYQRTYVLQGFYDYLNYLKILLDSEWEKYNSKKMFGSAIPYIKLNNIENFIVPLPPLSEQKRIVDKIEQLEPFIEKYGQAETDLTELNSNFPEQIKKSILQYAIQGKLVKQDPNDEPASVLLKKIKAEKNELIKQGKIKKDKEESYIFKGPDNHYYEKIGKITKDITEEIPFDIPKNWEWVRLNIICQLYKGKEIKDVNLPYLDVKYLRGNKPKEFTDNGYLLNINDFVILVDGENSGEVFIIKETGIMGSTFRQLIINSQINEDYILYYLKHYKSLLKQNKRGVAIPHLDKYIFKNLLFRLPPLSEQKRIVDKLEALMNIIKTL